MGIFSSTSMQLILIFATRSRPLLVVTENAGVKISALASIFKPAGYIHLLNIEYLIFLVSRDILDLIREGFLP